jgi:hypothetical protein
MYIPCGVLNRINKGENVTDKIIHEKAKIEYINKKANEMKFIRVIKRQTQNQKKIRSSFANIK